MFQRFEKFDSYEIELVGYPDCWAVVGVHNDEPKPNRYYLNSLGNSVKDTTATAIGIYNRDTAEKVARFFYKRAGSPQIEKVEPENGGIGCEPVSPIIPF